MTNPVLGMREEPGSGVVTLDIERLIGSHLAIIARERRLPASVAR